MNIKKITFLLLSLCSITSVSLKAGEFAYNNLYAGQVNVMAAPMELPDLGRWHYFAFDEWQGVVFKGTSDFELENVTPGKTGTEKINTGWQARSDWDFAFHAYDFRTNSGLAGNGNAGAIFIADAASAQGSSLDAIYAALTEAPVTTYAGDAVVNGTFYLSLTQGMPPLRATSLSVNSATRSSAKAASSDFSTLAMAGGATDNPMIIVLKTTSGKYVKVYLKQFVEDGKPGFLKFEYDFIPLETTSGISVAETSELAILSDELQVNLSENADIAIYNLTGLPVKQVNAQSGLATIPVHGWVKGTYIVKITSGKGCRIQKISIR
ncbi:HmuY family protein [Viscerimonas tarda]